MADLDDTGVESRAPVRDKSLFELSMHSLPVLAIPSEELQVNLQLASLNSRRIWNLFLALALLLGITKISAPEAKVQAAPNAWTLTGAMNTSRSDHTATLLNSGLVLVVGGNPNGSSVELYDPATGAWTATSDLSTSRLRHAAVLLDDGRAMVVGGGSSSAEIYDPNTGAWTVGDSMSTGRAYPTLTLLHDGRVLVVGGYTTSAEIYDPDTDSWTAAASLSAIRYLHTATLLPDGRVLVAGGRGPDWTAAIDDVEIYDPVADAWTTVDSLNTQRMYHTATLLPNGQVLVVGGNSGNNTHIASAELYNPATDSWSTTAGSLTEGRWSHTATLLPDGQVLIAGGFKNASPNFLGSVELYNPATGYFTTVASLNQSRYIHTATLLPDGRVLAAGGWSGGSARTSTELYDHVPSAPTWVYGEAMPTQRVEYAGTLLADGRVLVTGGRFGSTYPATTEIYDPAIAGWTITSSLNVTRTNHTMTLLNDGRVLVAGGYNSASGYLTSTELYDPETGLFSATGSMDTGRNRHTATLLSNGWVLVVGGYNSTDGYLSSAEIYDPDTSTWTVVNDMAITRGMHTATLLPDGQVLVAGGYGDSTFRNRLELYNLSADTWTTVDYLTNPRREHTATLLPNGKVLFAGGYNPYDGQLDSYEIYDPVADAWDSGGTMNTARTQHAAMLLPNGRVLVIGGNTTGGNPTTSTELYDPTTDSWDVIDMLNYPRLGFVAALLLDGQVLVAGTSDGPAFTSTTELYDPVLTYTAWQYTDDLNAARYVHAATLLTDGRVLLSGGTGSTPFMTSSELYYPTTGTFTTTGTLSAGRFAHSSTLLDDGQVLVAGGLGSGASAVASAELYNPSTGIFLPTTGNLGTGRYNHTATRLPDGQVLIAGGYGSSVLSSAEIYSPTLGTFSATGSLVTGRDGHTASPLPDGSVLIAGGSGYLAQSERYDPSTATFTNTTGTLATGRIEHTATVLPDGRVLVAGGRNSAATPLTSAELYIPGTDTWTTAGSMNVARYNHAATLLPDGRVLVAGGYNNSDTYLDSAEVYDPVMDDWTTVDDLHAARMNHTATALANGRVLVAGGTDGSALGSAELYVQGQPFLTDVTPSFIVGDPFTATGSTFRYRPETSGGNNMGSPTNAPLVQLMRLDSEQVRWLPVDPTTPFSDTLFTSLPVEDWPTGYARATVFVNGIPSIAQTVQILPRLGEVDQVVPPANSHTAPITTNLTMTFHGVLDNSSVTSQTVIVHGGFQGRMDGTFSFGSAVFDPAEDFHPGGLVNGTITKDVLVNSLPLSRTFVWQFRTTVLAGSGHFTDSGQVLDQSAQSWDVDLGDLDGDGDLDAFTTKWDANRVWLNDGAGFFSIDQNLGSENSRGAALGDLDGDGDLDIYVANFGAANGVWINQGNAQGGTTGTFSLTHSVGLSNTNDVELGDLDGDGDLDALAANYGQSSRVWLNDGTGMFAAAQDLPSADSFAVALGDLDGDGDLDAVEANYKSPQGIYLNDGSGSFSAHPSPPPLTTDPTRDVEMGDLDGDGDLDLLVVQTYQSMFQYGNAIWLNDGAGTFTQHQELDDEPSYGGALGDLDADGDLDAWIVIGAGDGGPATIWINDGTGTMTQRQSTASYDSFNVSLGDLDGDGDLDAFIANEGASVVWFNLKQGQVTGVAPNPNTLSAPLTTTMTITTDVAVNAGSVTTQTVAVHGGFHGHMDGVFSFGSVIFDPAEDLHPGELVRTTVTTDVIANGMPLVGPYIWQFRTAVESGRGWFVDSGQTLGDDTGRTAELGDLDGDGDLDVFVSNYNQANTAWLNDGSGTYQQVWTDTVSSGSWPFGMALGDLDGDGDLDVYEAAMWSNDRVLLNNGDGTFSHGQSIGSSDGRRVELADLDGDGDLDAFVATASNSNPPNRVYLNDGTGTLVGGQSMSNRRSQGVALGDLDGDGDLDAFVANIGYGTPPEGPNEVWLNDGDGTFTNTEQSLGFAESQSVALGDLDGDGDLDAFVANQDSEPNTVWFNDGEGTFTDSGQTLGAQTSLHVELGDVDGDGDLDAFVANTGSGNPNQVWINDGSGTFSPSGQEVSTNSSGVSLGDVDGDGDLDAFIARSGEDHVWFNQNAADLTISKSVETPIVGPSSVVTYTLVYTNNGPEIASGVVITDHTPVTLTNIHYGASPPITPTGTFSYTWLVGQLDVGEGGIITVTGVVSDGVTGVFSLTNEAIITSTLVFDVDLDNNRSIVTNTFDADPPDPPILLSPTDGTTIGDSTPTLTWEPSATAAGYLLDLSGTVTDVSNITAYTTTVLADGVYTWTVAAYDDVGNTSDYTDTWSFTVSTVALNVIEKWPSAGTEGVAVDAPIIITFTKPVNTGTFDFGVAPPDPGGWTPTWNGTSTVVTLTHNAFSYWQVVTATIQYAEDLADNPLPGLPYIWEFTVIPRRVQLPLVLRSY